jgi:hypothetical protein
MSSSNPYEYRQVSADGDASSSSAFEARIRRLEEENLRLRQQSIDARTEIQDLREEMAASEAILLHQTKKEVEKYQSEINFRVRKRCCFTNG